MLYSKKTFLQMDNKHMKRHSASLTIRETQINTTVRRHLIPEGPSSKNLQPINAGKDVEKKELFYTVGGNVN